MDAFAKFALQFHEDIYEEDDEGNVLRIPSFDELVFHAAPDYRDALENLLADLNMIIAKKAFDRARKLSLMYAATPFMIEEKEREQIHRIKKIVEILIECSPITFPQLEMELKNRS